MPVFVMSIQRDFLSSPVPQNILKVPQQMWYYHRISREKPWPLLFVAPSSDDLLNYSLFDVIPSLRISNCIGNPLSIKSYFYISHHLCSTIFRRSNGLYKLIGLHCWLWCSFAKIAKKDVWQFCLGLGKQSHYVDIPHDVDTLGIQAYVQVIHTLCKRWGFFIVFSVTVSPAIKVFRFKTLYDLIMMVYPAFQWCTSWE